MQSSKYRSLEEFIKPVPSKAKRPRTKPKYEPERLPTQAAIEKALLDFSVENTINQTMVYSNIHLWAAAKEGLFSLPLAGDKINKYLNFMGKFGTCTEETLKAYQYLVQRFPEMTKTVKFAQGWKYTSEEERIRKGWIEKPKHCYAQRAQHALLLIHHGDQKGIYDHEFSRKPIFLPRGSKSDGTISWTRVGQTEDKCIFVHDEYGKLYVRCPCVLSFGKSHYTNCQY